MADINNKDNLISLRELYQNVVDTHQLSEVTMQRLLTPASSMKFIRQRFSMEQKEPDIKSCIDRITPNRSVHTVSSFLLGLAIRDNLSIDTRSWRRLPEEKTPTGSFTLFWTWICLYHDIAYIYENDHESYKEYQQLEELIEYLDLRFNLLHTSKFSTLIRNYYAYRNRPGDKATIDHGIVGAILLYNALCVLSTNNGVYSNIKDYRRFYTRISDTVALHNMWRATEETLREYEDNGLYELIPDEDRHHIIYYKDDPMLFLLALVDTIDPIKKLSLGKKSTVYDILNNYKVRFVNTSKGKEMIISYESPCFEEYASQLADPRFGMQTWLGVYLKRIPSKNQIVITIDTVTGKITP